MSGSRVFDAPTALSNCLSSFIEKFSPTACGAAHHMEKGKGVANEFSMKLPEYLPSLEYDYPFDPAFFPGPLHSDAFQCRDKEKSSAAGAEPRPNWRTPGAVIRFNQQKSPRHHRLT